MTRRPLLRRARLPPRHAQCSKQLSRGHRPPAGQPGRQPRRQRAGAGVGLPVCEEQAAFLCGCAAGAGVEGEVGVSRFFCCVGG